MIAGRVQPRAIAAFLVTSIALVLVADFLVVQQSLDGPRGYGDVGCNECDVQSYLAMVDQHWPWDVNAPASVPAPFRYRIWFRGSQGTFRLNRVNHSS